MGQLSGYVSQERGATIYPSNKNFVLEISTRREMNMEEIKVNDDNMIKYEGYGRLPTQDTYLGWLKG